MVRNILGGLLALAGATAAVRSPFRIWFDGRHGTDVRVDDLFTGVGVTPRHAALPGSLFLPMGFAALLALLGVLLLSWAVVGLAGVLVGGVAVLWAVRQEQASDALTLGGTGLGSGAAWAVGGAGLLLAGAAVLRSAGRTRYGAGGTTAGACPAPGTLGGLGPGPVAEAPAAGPGQHPSIPEAIRTPPLPDPPPRTPDVLPGTPASDGLPDAVE